MADYFPRDVLIDILARLPIDTIVQCTSVCKSWYSLLTNPSFITTHLNRSIRAIKHHNHINNDLLIVRHFDEDPHSKDCSVERYALLCNNETLDEYKELEFPFKNSWNKYYTVIGSCNGLICLYDDMFTYCGTMFLWNPSIRKVLQLPPFRVRFNTHGPYGHTFGFGFDPVTDDYKVVRIVYLDREMDPPEDPPEVDVYSLNNGTWRNISHSVNHRMRYLSARALFISTVLPIGLL